MFDIGFLEIFVILVIGLLVIGPERMPEVARKIGRFTGKMRNFVNTMKDNSELHDTIREVKDAVDFEEEKRNLQNIEKDLTNDMKFDDINIDEFNRPSFGGDPKNLEETHSSPFRQAPAQPQIPGSDLEQGQESVPANKAPTSASLQSETDYTKASTHANERPEPSAETSAQSTDNTESTNHSEPATHHKS